MSDQMISWTPMKLRRFKIGFIEAEQASRDVFEFEGHEFLTDYARYLIKYLDGVFKAQLPTDP